jgi:hypothetical protein
METSLKRPSALFAADTGTNSFQNSFHLKLDGDLIDARLRQAEA